LRDNALDDVEKLFVSADTARYKDVSAVYRIRTAEIARADLTAQAVVPAVPTAVARMIELRPQSAVPKRPGD